LSPISPSEKDNADGAAGEAVRFRIGIHVGEVIVEGTNLFGDAVNIAARLEVVAELGRVCVSATVRDQIGTRLPVGFTDLGEQQVKNIAPPECTRSAASPIPQLQALSCPCRKPSIAVRPFANMSGDSQPEYFADGIQPRFDEAAAKLLASPEQRPSLALTYRFLASCYTHMGRLGEAREIVERLRTITPVVVPSTTPYRNPELLLSGLRLAAGEGGHRPIILNPL
jgi:hypothetical protein